MRLCAGSFIVRLATLAVLLVLFPGPVGFAQTDTPPELVAATEPRSPEQERQAFRLPPGFEAQLVASEPDIQKPMNLAFDARGRLWVTHSREYPYAAEDASQARDGVTILDEIGPDGRARSITRFAEGLNIPIGVLPLGDGSEALVHSIPDIYHMVDDNGDGKADRKEAWYSSIGHRDTHGMANSFTWGFDGWIYGCHGFSNDSTVAGRDGRSIQMNSGNTYRLRPDGSHIEQVTWGQVNPFGLAFDPLGNLYSCDCHSRPLYLLLPGAYYPSFGKPHDGLGYGPEMCPHDHGSTGIAGVAYYAAGQFPAEYRDTLFVGNVVTSRINHDRLSWTGSTPRAIEQPDFLVSDDPWFRPVDLELGPDGALYVADFYNRIIGHYEVPLTHPGRDRDRGRIWRIVYKGDQPHAEATAPRADWTELPFDALLDDLGHPNLAVRTTAANEIARRGDPQGVDIAKTAITDQDNVARQVHGLWLLFRLGALEEAMLGDAAGAEHRELRVHAMKVLAELPKLSPALRTWAIEGLSDSDPFVRRAAGQVLGKHPDAANVRPLVEARLASDAGDTHLVHALRIALRDQFRGGADWPSLAQGDWTPAALNALVDVAPGVHGIDSARFVIDFLGKAEVSAEERQRFAHHVARYGDETLDKALLDWVATVSAEGLSLRAELLKQISQGLEERGSAAPEQLRDQALELARSLIEDGGGQATAVGYDLAVSLKLTPLFEQITQSIQGESTTLSTRQAAFVTLLAIDRDRAIEWLGQVLVDPGALIDLRVHAANLLGQGGPTRARQILLNALPTAPARLEAPIATALAVDRDGAEALLALLADGKVSPRILNDRAVEIRLRAAGVPEIDTRLSELTQGLPPVDEAIQALLAGRHSGFATAEADPGRGVEIFEKNCAICHKLGGAGAEIGPQLDGVGVRGAERLIEDILDPNRNVDQAFRTTILALDDGRIVSGLQLREEGEIVVLADSRGQEVRVPRASIEEHRVSSISPMPADLSAQIPESQFYDLLAYLLSQQQEPIAADPAANSQ